MLHFCNLRKSINLYAFKFKFSCLSIISLISVIYFSCVNLFFKNLTYKSWIICWYCRTSLLHEKAETFFSHTESTFFVRHSSEYETSDNDRKVNRNKVIIFIIRLRVIIFWVYMQLFLLTFDSPPHNITTQKSVLRNLKKVLNWNHEETNKVSILQKRKDGGILWV